MHTPIAATRRPTLRPTRRPAALRHFAALALLLFCGESARGQTTDETGAWAMLMLEGPLGPPDSSTSRWRWWLDLQPRFHEDVSGLQQGLFRPGLGYELGEQTTAWLGYARVYTESASGSSSNEDRIWQQLLWKPRVGELGLQSRTRLEQRFLDTGSGTGWRFRQFMKASWELPRSSRLSLVGYDEVFLNLNDTSWGQRTGFAQNRLFVGLGVKPEQPGRAKLEIGYLNQYLDLAGPDRSNHILSINLFLNF